MAKIILSEASGELQALYGEVQAPLASYIEHKAEEIEKEESVALEIFRKVKSTHRVEMYAQEGEMEDMKPVGEGGEYPTTGYGQGYDQIITNVTYKNSFAITEELMDDNILTSLGQKPDKLLRTYYRGRTRNLAAMLGNALQGNATFSKDGWTHSTKCMDGNCVFHTAHPAKFEGGTQANMFADAFTVDALFAMITKMNCFKDDSGNTLSITPDTIIIPSHKPALKMAVIKAIASMQEPGTGYNAINPIFGNLKIICWSALNDFCSTYSPWILFDSKYNQVVDGNIYQERKELTIRSVLAHNDSNEWLARARYGMGFVDWRQMAVGGITGCGSSL